MSRVMKKMLRILRKTSTKETTVGIGLTWFQSIRNCTERALASVVLMGDVGRHLNPPVYRPPGWLI